MLGKKDDQGQHVSYLSADSVRWMNKRRPKGGSAAAVHVLPSRALQLSHIFKGLDFDDSKTIDIEELKVRKRYLPSASETIIRFQR